MAVRYEPGDTAGALAKHKDAFFHILSDTRQPEIVQRLNDPSLAEDSKELVSLMVCNPIQL